MSDASMHDGPRFAIYFAPPSTHPLWHAGCRWLGRDAAVAAATMPPRDGIADPWRYGLHATLKAPMRLRPDAAEAAWIDAVACLARTHRAFALPPLEIGELAGFLALRPASPLARSHPLWRLADDCVTTLDPWRAAPTEAERARQMKPGLDDRQRGHVTRFGYAFVLDDWRFHMTLSDSLGAADPRCAALRAEAQACFATALAVPLWCEDLCIFVEPAPDAPFVLRHRLPLAKS